MARPESIPESPQVDSDEPPIDTTEAIRHAYRFHRIRRRVRIERTRRQRYAGVRFAFTLALLVFVFVVLSLTVWNEIQRLFGL